MAISYVTEQHGGSSTSNLTVAVGDLLIAFARNDGSGVLPTVPSGWTQQLTGGQSGSYNGCILATKVATSTSEASGTWTSADSLDIVAYRGASGIGSTPNTTSETTSTQTVPTTTLTMDVTDGTSWVVIWQGRRNNNGSDPGISGYTNRVSNDLATDDGDAWSVVYDSAGGKTSYTGTTYDWGGSASGSSDSFVVEVLEAASASSTHIVVSGDISVDPQIALTSVSVATDQVTVSGTTATIDPLAVIDVVMRTGGTATYATNYATLSGYSWTTIFNTVPTGDYDVVATVTEEDAASTAATSATFSVLSSGSSGGGGSGAAGAGVDNPAQPVPKPTLPLTPQTQYDAALLRRLTEVLLTHHNALNSAYELLSRIASSSSAVPTSGTWAVGDFVWNTAPTELGLSGSKYIVIGWLCTTAGTPGTWSENRVLTGN